MNFYKLLKMDYQKLKEANDKLAFEEFKKDADRGHRICQFQIAMMYENGIGTEKNPEKAFEYYEKAANQGCAISQNALGYMYREGNGTAQNPEKAFEYYEKAANQGHADAQNNLAEMYKLGEGRVKNMKKAFEYYEKAANQGHAEAKIELEKLLSSQCESANPSSAQLTQPIQPIAVKRPFVLNISESSAFSSAKKQAISQ